MDPVVADEPNPKTPEELAEDAIQWITSDSGAAELAKALEECKRIFEEMERQRRIKWEDLHRPMTI